MALGFTQPGSSGAKQTYKTNSSADKPYSDEFKERLAREAESRASAQRLGGQLMVNNPYGTATFSNVQRAFAGNGNPLYKKGEANVTLSDGTSLRIPNALAQTLLFTEGVNEGRFNAGSVFEGQSKLQQEQNPALKYKDYSLMQHTLDQFMKNNPEYSGNGFINPALDKIQRIQDLDNQINELSSRLFSRREVVGADGTMQQDGSMGQQNSIEALKRERDSLGNVSAKDIRKSNKGGAGLFSKLDGLQRNLLGPTLSNLQIKEQVVS